jgi:hypothetical protein
VKLFIVAEIVVMLFISCTGRKDNVATNTSPREAVEVGAGKVAPTPEEVLSAADAEAYRKWIILVDEFSENAETGQELHDAESKATVETAAQLGISPDALSAIIDRYNLTVTEFYHQ